MALNPKQLLQLGERWKILNGIKSETAPAAGTEMEDLQ